MCNRINPPGYATNPVPINKTGFGAKALYVKYTDGIIEGMFSMNSYEANASSFIEWDHEYAGAGERAFTFFRTRDEAERWLEVAKKADWASTRFWQHRIRNCKIFDIEYKDGICERFENDRCINGRICLCKAFRIIR